MTLPTQNPGAILLKHAIPSSAICTRKWRTLTNSISVDGKSFRVFKTKDPAEIDWPSVGAEIVIESTGLFTKGSDARQAQAPGPVKKVIISAPATDEDLTVVLGVNR